MPPVRYHWKMAVVSVPRLSPLAIATRVVVVAVSLPELSPTLLHPSRVPSPFSTSSL